MQAKLKKVGEDLALVLDASTWSQLGIDEGSEIEVTADVAGLHIRRIAEGHRDRVLSSARRMIDVHEETFRKLAL